MLHFIRKVPSLHLPKQQNRWVSFFNSGASSSLARELIKGDRSSEDHYNRYLKAYTEAKEFIKIKDYTRAREAASVAHSELLEVNTITSSIMADLSRTLTILDQIEEVSESAFKYNK